MSTSNDIPLDFINETFYQPSLSMSTVGRIVGSLCSMSQVVILKLVMVHSKSHVLRVIFVSI